jgi:drug/metabolite transporter (DMT)-like permease
MNNSKGFLSLLCTGIIYSINDIIIRVLGNQLSGMQQVTYRSFIALVTIIIIQSPFTIFKNLKKIKVKFLLFYTVAFPIVFVLFNMSILTTKIADTVFAFFIGTVLISFVIDYCIIRIRITKIKIISAFLALFGIFCFSFPISHTGLNSGFILGLVSGFLYSGINTGIKLMNKNIDKLTVVAVQMFGGVIVTGGILAVTKQTVFPQLTLQGSYLVLISSLLLLLATFLILVGFQNFDLNLGTIIISSELFFAPLFAYLLLHESLTFFEIAGGIFIGLAMILPQINRQQQL